MSHQALIALGSNLAGDLQNPKAQLDLACHLLAQAPGISLRSVSPYFETEPVGYLNQPRFFNAVCLLDTALPPQALLAALMAIEQAMGRMRDPEIRFGPRVIDLDLLMYDRVRINTSTLTLPHPRMHQRAFVLVPLAALLDTLKQSDALLYPEISAWVDANLPAPLSQCLDVLNFDAFEKIPAS